MQAPPPRARNAGRRPFASPRWLALATGGDQFDAATIGTVHVPGPGISSTQASNRLGPAAALGRKMARRTSGTSLCLLQWQLRFPGVRRAAYWTAYLPVGKAFGG
jgi:hypothetical protein